MADVSHLISLGLGTPDADIPHLILFGLTPSGAVRPISLCRATLEPITPVRTLRPYCPDED